MSAEHLFTEEKGTSCYLYCATCDKYSDQIIFGNNDNYLKIGKFCAKHSLLCSKWGNGSYAFGAMMMKTMIDNNDPFRDVLEREDLNLDVLKDEILGSHLDRGYADICVCKSPKIIRNNKEL